MPQCQNNAVSQNNDIFPKWHPIMRFGNAEFVQINIKIARFKKYAKMTKIASDQFFKGVPN